MDSKLFELIVGSVMPLVIDLINSKILNSKVRYFVSMGICLGIGTLFNINSLNAGDILASGAIIFGAAQTVYKTYWGQSDARAKVFGEAIRS